VVSHATLIIEWFCTANLVIPGGMLLWQYATHKVKSNKESELSRPILLKLGGKLQGLLFTVCVKEGK